MIVTLDPRMPIFWRDQNTLQIGLESSPVILHDVTPAIERLIGALAAGSSRDALRRIARHGSVDPAIVDVLLESLGEHLAAPSEARPRGYIAVDGGGPHTTAIREAILGAVTPTGERSADEHPRLGVIVADYVITPSRAASWMSGGVAHLPVVFDDAGARIGPVIIPGETPCLRCRDLHRRDLDEDWPTIAAQLNGRPAPASPPALVRAIVSRAALSVANYLLGVPPEPVAIRLNRNDPHERLESQHFHPECGCRSLEGNATDPAATTDGPPFVPTSA